jgi:hypothetical protein
MLELVKHAYHQAGFAHLPGIEDVAKLPALQGFVEVTVCRAHYIGGSIHRQTSSHLIVKGGGLFGASEELVFKEQFSLSSFENF